VVPMLLFFIWNPWLTVGQDRIPKRSLILLALLTALQAWDLIRGWKYGVQYQGLEYTVRVCVINFYWLVLLWLQLVRTWRKSSFPRNLLFHWTLFAWLAWYAFPYFGELI